MRQGRLWWVHQICPLLPLPVPASHCLTLTTYPAPQPALPTAPTLVSSSHPVPVPFARPTHPSTPCPSTPCPSTPCPSTPCPPPRAPRPALAPAPHTPHPAQAHPSSTCTRTPVTRSWLTSHGPPPWSARGARGTTGHKHSMCPSLPAPSALRGGVGSGLARCCGDSSGSVPPSAVSRSFQ